MMPAAGPARSTCTMPGTRRSARAPSSTTTVCVPGGACSSARCSISVARALTWWAIDSSSRAARTRAPAPSGVRACGSQHVHSHSRPTPSAMAGATSTVMLSSAGEWRTAHWDTIQRAVSRRLAPAMPATPRRPRGTVTGTSGAVHLSGSS